MARTFKHHHRCQDCQTKTECFGQLEDNYDGEPEITCREFHLQGGEINGDFICDYCQERRDERAAADRAEQEAEENSDNAGALS